jgi:hypothetical protein
MVELQVSLKAKWAQFLKSLADSHQTDLNNVVNELCEWAFSNSEDKKQFDAWLDEAYPSKGDVEDKQSVTGEEASENEEEAEEESEEEAHEDRDYSEDRESKP